MGLLYSKMCVCSVRNVSWTGVKIRTGWINFPGFREMVDKYMKRKDLMKLCAAAVSAAMIMGTTGAALAEESNAETVIVLSDNGITVDGTEISTDESAAVYAGAEIVYYQAGQGATYGAGDEDDGHTAEEAAEHTVVTITQPGTFRVSGSISKGQIAVDLGEDAEDDANAVVNLILDQAEINCSVASGIVVYNAYECGSDEVETATKDVDTTGAGFNLILADGTENTVNGSHVAKIYKEGTTQEQIDADEAKKLWKFDAAIDSLVSFNITGEEAGDGKLNVIADNEGVSSALHMTINGGEIVISSADDAINASEDGVSVLTINGGTVTCDSGLGAEGDGIDSNGWIVVNGGYTIACANASSQDSGVDADMGIYVNGGTVLASGNMYDEVSADSQQAFLVLNFAEAVEEGQLLMMKNSNDEPVAAFSAVNAFTTTVYSSNLLSEGDYTLYKVSSVEGELNGSIYTNITGYEGEVQLQYSGTGMMGAGGFGGFGGGRGQMPGGMQQGEMPKGMEVPESVEAGERPKMPEGGQMPEGMEKPEGGELPEGMEKPENGQMPEGMEKPEGGQMPEGMEMPEAGQMPEEMEVPEGGQMPEGMEKPEGGEVPEGIEMPEGRGNGQGTGGQAELSTTFTIAGVQNTFSQITEVQ